MRRVVVTGMGIVSCLGNDLDSVSLSLAEGRPGIRMAPGYAEMGLRSQVAGIPHIEIEKHLDRRDLRFMGDAAAFAAISLKAAIADAGLTQAHVSNPRTGLIAGSGGGSPANVNIASGRPYASVVPIAPAPTANTRLSVNSCRTSLARLAPTDRRTPISRARAAPRASKRFPTLAQAMTSMSKTPRPINPRIGKTCLFDVGRSVNVVPAKRSRCGGIASGDRNCRLSVSSSAPACALVTSGFSRPATSR